MRRIPWILAVILILLPIFAVSAFAAGRRQGTGTVSYTPPADRICVDQTTCVNGFQQENANGETICNEDSIVCEANEDAKVICAEGTCAKCGQHIQYVDMDKDGICDHRAECEGLQKSYCRNQTGRHGHSNGKHGKHH